MKLPDSELWKKLSPALDELLELGPQARANRLAELHDSDPALHERLNSILNAAKSAAGWRFLLDETLPAPNGDAPGLNG